MNLIEWIKNKYKSYTKKKEYQKKIEELRKRDPFNYKNF